MSEEQSEGGSSKSKQERIRDNQRRSRARRQEYLADLERRLAECQATCREADLQRASFLELQIENTRLRELLSLAGVNEPFVEQYIAQTRPPPDHNPQDTSRGLRPLKPNLRPVTINDINSAYSLSSSSQASTPFSIPPAGSSSLPDPPLQTSYTSHGAVPTIPLQGVERPAQNPSLEWLLQQFPKSFQPPQQNNDALYCEPFQVVTPNPPRPPDENTVLCSVAKDMIGQFQISDQDMDQIKVKLATSFRQPAFQGGQCGVDNQVLFQILNELSTSHPS